jgi:hypothetical protein
MAKRAVDGGAAQVFTDEEVIDLADALLVMMDAADNAGDKRFEALLDTVAAQSRALAALTGTATLADVATLADPVIEHFDQLRPVHRWTQAKKVALITGGSRLRLYARNNPAAFRLFVNTVKGRTNDAVNSPEDKTLPVHW